MLLNALRAKFLSRGPLGFLDDCAELAVACTIAGVSCFGVAVGAVIVGVVGTPVLAIDLLARPEGPRESVTDRTSCRNAEEAS